MNTTTPPTTDRKPEGAARRPQLPVLIADDDLCDNERPASESEARDILAAHNSEQRAAQTPTIKKPE